MPRNMSDWSTWSEHFKKAKNLKSNQYAHAEKHDTKNSQKTNFVSDWEVLVNR